MNRQVFSQECFTTVMLTLRPKHLSLRRGNEEMRLARRYPEAQNDAFSVVIYSA